jgi:AAA+ ATPase superfamily predicted ATPase
MAYFNPFIVYGYESGHYFCDRETETRQLETLLANGNNVLLMGERRIGKSGLIEHLFHQKDFSKNRYVFHIDIYSTKNLNEMVQALGKGILTALQPWGKRVMMKFVDAIRSLRYGISFDINGNPSWNVDIGEISQPQITLDEIFDYLEQADKPCIVAIDEFQTVASYQDGNVEALLRTYIQKCHNAEFVFSGSQNTMVSEMFLSPARPFYQSCSLMHLKAIPCDTYTAFAQHLFEENGKRISSEAVEKVYRQFDGVTWYLQRVMNSLYSRTPKGAACGVDAVDEAVSQILDDNAFSYESLLFLLPSKQKDLLIAISKEGQARAVTSAGFVKKYKLQSASSVQSALRGLLDKQFVNMDMGTYTVADKFFRLWLLRKTVG